MNDGQRLNKFARLLGGNKKTSSSSSPLGGATAVESRSHANMAMTAGKERQLNATLTRQFDAALEIRRLPSSAKTGGLGFSAPAPAQTKKFYIDNAASGSKKFY